MCVAVWWGGGRGSQSLWMVLICPMGSPLPFFFSRCCQMGFVFVVGEASVDWFYIFSEFGITPLPNAKFDLFYLFNHIMGDHGRSVSKGKPICPPEVLEFIENALGHITEVTSSITYHSRISDAERTWFCGQRGDLRTDDKRTAAVWTPEKMLRSAFFEIYRGRPVGSTKQILNDISDSGPLPDIRKLGNGVLI